MDGLTLVDGFCGGGGASVGYSRAGFDVVGIDIVPQPRYPFPFILGDFLVILPRMLCGSWFGLDIRRHRLFEVNFPAFSTPCSHHWQKPRYRSLDGRRKKLASVVGVHGHINYAGEFALRQRAMGIDWMSPEELSQAIPPAYTEWLGRQIMAYLATTA
jgi:hypothetical protein